MDQKVEINLNSSGIGENSSITIAFQQLQIETPQDYNKKSDSTTTINVQIRENQSREETVGKYIVYIVQGSDREGNFEVTRRFNDFDVFRHALVTRWPGCFVPPLPLKRPIGNLDDTFIKERMQMLEDFLRQLSINQILWYSEETHTFLHSYDIPDLDKHYSNLQKQTNEEIIRKYEINFKNLAGVQTKQYEQLEINLQLTNNISNFQQFLKQVLPMLGNFKDIYRNLQKARDNHSDQYYTLLTYLFPEYEKNCLLEYSGGSLQNAIFSDQDSVELKSLIERLKEFFDKNEFSQLLVAIKLEQREIEAFTEALAQRDLYEGQRAQEQQKLKNIQIELQEIIAGKTTFKKIFSSTTKEEQIAKYQIRLDLQNKEIDQYNFLCDIITVILGYVEIVRFRKDKEAAYFRMIKQVAEFELEFSKIQTQFWEYILANKSIYMSQQQ